MAIRPRVRSAAPTKNVDEEAIAAIINRGGAPAGGEVEAAAAAMERLDPDPIVPPIKSSAGKEAVEIDPERKFTLRLPASLLAEIEKAAKGRPDRISVNTWLIGAALQRLERKPEGGGS